MVERKRLVKVLGAISLVLVLVVLPFMVACAKPAAVKPQEDVILLAGCGVGGTSYPQSTGLMKIVNEFVPGYNAVAQVTGCSVENCRLLDARKVFCGLISQSAMQDAHAGVGAYDHKIPVALMSYTSIFYEWLMTLNPNIKSVQDLKGKTIAIGDPGSGNAKHALAMLDAWGFKEEVDFKPLYLGESAAAAALRDGIADAWSADGTTVQASIVELTTVEKVYFIRLTPEEVEAASNSIKGRMTVDVPANTYRGQDQPLRVPGGLSTWSTRLDADEDLVYTVLKAMWEHMDIMIETHASCKDYVIERNGTIDIGLPFHPAAIKYYKEVGVWKD